MGQNGFSTVGSLFSERLLQPVFDILFSFFMTSMGLVYQDQVSVFYGLSAKHQASGRLDDAARASWNKRYYCGRPQRNDASFCVYPNGQNRPFPARCNLTAAGTGVSARQRREHNLLLQLPGLKGRQDIALPTQYPVLLPGSAGCAARQQYRLVATR